MRVRRIRSGASLYGFGADEPTTPAPASAPTETPAVDARKASAIGKGLFVGTAYGIALGMVVSELVLRKRDATAQLKQNHQFIGLSALFGAMVGGLITVQSERIAA
jgi:hypothetical protein